MNERLARVAMEDSVLEHMSYDFVQIKENQTVGQALASIRENPTIGHFIYFYVVDEQGCLVGVVPTRRLLLSGLETTIEEVLIRDVITISDQATVLDAFELFTLHRLLAFPIVDGKRRLVGVVDVSLYTEGRTELEEAERSEDLFQLIGVHLSESQNSGPIAAFASRFPWLICNIVGGLLAAFISGVFEAELERVVALALFVPVVLGLSESVSIQSVSLTLQWLHGRPPTLAGLWTKLRREFLVGLMLGSVCAIVVAAVSVVWLHDYRVAVCIFVGIGGGVTAAALVGVAMPNVLRILKRNPQVAAGPIALATADMIALLVYFSLARLVTS